MSDEEKSLDIIAETIISLRLQCHEALADKFLAAVRADVKDEVIKRIKTKSMLRMFDMALEGTGMTTADFGLRKPGEKEEPS